MTTELNKGYEATIIADVTALPEVPEDGIPPRQALVNGYDATVTFLANGGSGGVTSVDTGTGLTGGPITDTGTISMADTAVTPGSYTSADITVDAQGRITSAASGSNGDTTVLWTGSATSGTATLSQDMDNFSQLYFVVQQGVAQRFTEEVPVSEFKLSTSGTPHLINGSTDATTQNVQYYYTNDTTVTISAASGTMALTRIVGIK